MDEVINRIICQEKLRTESQSAPAYQPGKTVALNKILVSLTH